MVEITRPSPSYSATAFGIGTKKRGNDNRMYIITATKNGTRRWKPFNAKAITSRARAYNPNTERGNGKALSVEQLQLLKRKYSVLGSGSKKEMAQAIWMVSWGTIESKDIVLLMPFLNREQRQKATKQLKERLEKPITNYHGMWKPLPKPISKMTREELITGLRQFRNAWHKNGGPFQDLDNARLQDEKTDSLRNLIDFYYSNAGKLSAENWIRRKR